MIDDFDTVDEVRKERRGELKKRMGQQGAKTLG